MSALIILALSLAGAQAQVPAVVGILDAPVRESGWPSDHGPWEKEHPAVNGLNQRLAAAGNKLFRFYHLPDVGWRRDAEGDQLLVVHKKADHEFFIPYLGGFHQDGPDLKAELLGSRLLVARDRVGVRVLDLSRDYDREANLLVVVGEFDAKPPRGEDQLRRISDRTAAELLLSEAGFTPNAVERIVGFIPKGAAFILSGSAPREDDPGRLKLRVGAAAPVVVYPQ